MYFVFVSRILVIVMFFEFRDSYFGLSRPIKVD